MIILNDIPLEINFKSLMETSHIGLDSDYRESLENVFNTAISIASPKAIVKKSYIDSLKEGCVVVDGVEFRSKILSENLGETECIFPYIATCGAELDSIHINDDDLLEKYFLDVIKNVCLDVSISYLDKFIDEKFGIEETSSMNPGSSGLLVWELPEQQKLFSLFSDTSAIGVELTGSCLMIPNKSLSGIKFKSNTGFHNCRLCERKNCPTRFENYCKEL